MDHRATLSSYKFPPSFAWGEASGSCGPLSTPFSVGTAPNARPTVNTGEGALTESLDQTKDKGLGLRKEKCDTPAAMIAFVMRFRLRMKGTCHQVREALEAEFPDDPLIREGGNRFRTVSGTLYNQACFQNIGKDPSVSDKLVIYAFDPTVAGTESAKREKRNRAKARAACPEQNQNRGPQHRHHPYGTSRRPGAEEITPTEVPHNASRISFLQPGSWEASLLTGFGAHPSSWQQSPQTAAHDADTVFVTPASTSSWLKEPESAWPSASMTAVTFSEFGGMGQTPLFSPRTSMTLTMAELPPSRSVSPRKYKPSPIHKIDHPEEKEDAFMPNFDNWAGFGPQPSCAATTGLGIETSLDPLLGFDHPCLGESDWELPAPALEHNGGPAISNNRALNVSQGINPSSQCTEGVQEFLGSPGPQDAWEQYGSTTLDPGQLLTWDQIMGLILPNGTAELDPIAHPLPPTPNQPTDPQNVQEERDPNAYFAELLWAYGLAQ
ncbi:hypothetical protein FRC01_006792 [Tulasnella sp. 417]|nr:hypothetical protein FRC01_006792 [Tulasnella sp. 417]